MPWVRRLSSGLWAATVRLPGDKKLTKSFPLKGSADRWAAEQKAALSRGDWIDPRSARVTVGVWRDRVAEGRQAELATRKWETSIWFNHVAPRWERVEVGSILRPDVNAWIVAMGRAGVGAHTVVGAVNVLSALLEVAVDARLIAANPARGCKLPRLPAHIDRIVTPEEEDRLMASLAEKFGDRPDGVLFVRVLFGLGLRWEEAAALWRDQFDMRQAIVHVGPVMERDGTRRPHPKSKASERPVPVSRELWPALRELALTRSRGQYLFTSPDGEPLNYHNWLKRVWRAALFDVERGKRNKIMSRTAILDEPLPTPHDARHTYGTRLAEAGVPQHEIAALLGHAPGSKSTARYVHAGNVRFDRARDALASAHGS